MRVKKPGTVVFLGGRSWQRRYARSVKQRNPAIYTHCIRCGSPLPVEVHTYTSIKYVAAATVIMLVILAIVYVVVPALHLIRCDR